ncbi:uncharacterized protein MCYG_01052 [Microsporum canis CBS 113480]|uniref:Secreted protein n=1 Tax=Arthroderma otae (strain ATCC MYA-4605 / CBS 113480) TaxID=554155 RepID=C5FED0_ARTOC|nr:uncharacterized protein MCYG_01052 [Microsporum canis CBS 113480]EEQ28164.1 predicted protein [Microsporum canis CBS 113480]
MLVLRLRLLLLLLLPACLELAQQNVWTSHLFTTNTTTRAFTSRTGRPSSILISIVYLSIIYRRVDQSGLPSSLWPAVVSLDHEQLQAQLLAFNMSTPSHSHHTPTACQWLSLPVRPPVNRHPFFPVPCPLRSRGMA